MTALQTGMHFRSGFYMMCTLTSWLFYFILSNNFMTYKVKHANSKQKYFENNICAESPCNESVWCTLTKEPQKK